MIRRVPASTGTLVLQSDENLGSVQVTTFLSLILFGIVLAQGYIYFWLKFDDRRALKLLVTFLLVLEAFHSFTASHTIYFDTVTRFNRAEPNSYPLSTTVAIETLITVIVQSFFSYRVYRISGKLTLGIACFSLALCRFLGGVYLCVRSFLDVPRNPNGVMFVQKFSWLITSALACGGGADVLIAISMLYYLRRLASPLNLESTTQVINRLVRWSLQTGLVTSMTSVAVIVCFQAMGNMIWFGLYVLLAKVYSNSLLVSLNARPILHREAAPSTCIQFESAPPISVSFRTTRPGESIVLVPSPPKSNEDAC
ncbi:hypothetical protein GALMADRAFT_804733 [Galerina marginata CBS 339.88]|uniref:DUF6534 domain-containing protein n=1 Tax=Galerina marginata (strain CBS 339.88) TaxID=685588 RepID=A0A067STS5_GALM3|nr:hypothetical protein GALMADRAFT_804733 [Galerina marginata CBS 339.88]